jgi:hypothetical protein
MKYICNRCKSVHQADDTTIHYTTNVNGTLDIIALCPECLETYLAKTLKDTDQKEEDVERGKMERKW